MEKRINKKIETYILDFKDKIKQKATDMGLANDTKLSQLVQYIYDYDRLILNKEDFTKRKRVKNVVHLFDRCYAKRANGEQCTRRKKDGCEYCGTHMKGTPHGICTIEDDIKPKTEKISVWAQDIQGIIYYIDKDHNVYQIEDIMYGKDNPKVIAKYIKIGDIYTIPEFNRYNNQKEKEKEK
jgi:hypothetical protein